VTRFGVGVGLNLAVVLGVAFGELGFLGNGIFEGGAIGFVVVRLRRENSVLE